MFTGIVETQGEVVELSPLESGIRIALAADFADFAMGESIAVNGACMTVVAFEAGRFEVDVSAESARRTTLGSLVVGEGVNLERSLQIGDRLGGHFVTGHVDGVGSLASVTPEGESSLFRFEVPEGFERYLIEKGSVAVDGTSLTVFDCRDGGFTVAVIPHTLTVTRLGRLRVGDRVNLEADLLGKWVERLLAGGDVPNGFPAVPS